jgi:hypothetical protein
MSRTRSYVPHALEQYWVEHGVDAARCYVRSVLWSVFGVTHECAERFGVTDLQMKMGLRRLGMTMEPRRMRAYFASRFRDNTPKPPGQNAPVTNRR